ncbi:MAG TPA: hypothetical protein VE129_14445, partial [Thermoanaerobaculia bacterium]|nr:hypothetical protein [Thermoanaerobaculia bacterium]
MTAPRSPLTTGLSATFAYRRLAGVLWLGLLVSSLPAWFAFGPLFAPIDQGPFREILLKGWDSWAFLSFLGVFPKQVGVAFAAVGAGLVLSFLLDLLLTTGAIRVLLSELPRPALRRTVAEGAALFRPVAWSFARYVVSLTFWIGLLVAGPVLMLGKIAGKDAPPNGPLATFGLAWAVVASVLVAANVNLRFSFARIALARGDAANARGAYRAARAVLRGARPRAAGLWLFWLVLGLAIQAAFTALGVAMNPATAAGIAALVVVRQLGFWLFAMTRVGYQASLLRFADLKRPLPPLPLVHPIPH